MGRPFLRRHVQHDGAAHRRSRRGRARYRRRGWRARVPHAVRLPHLPLPPGHTRSPSPAHQVTPPPAHLTLRCDLPLHDGETVDEVVAGAFHSLVLTSEGRVLATATHTVHPPRRAPSLGARLSRCTACFGTGARVGRQHARPAGCRAARRLRVPADGRGAGGRRRHLAGNIYTTVVHVDRYRYRHRWTRCRRASAASRRQPTRPRMRYTYAVLVVVAECMRYTYVVQQ